MDVGSTTVATPSASALHAEPGSAPRRTPWTLRPSAHTRPRALRWGRTSDQNAIAGADARSFDAVGSHCRRLDERPLRMRYPLREPYDLILRDRGQFRHPAPRMGEPDTGHGRAQMLESTSAVGAGAAIGQRHDRDSIPFFDAGDSRADRDDVARELVTEDLRVLGSGERMRLDRRHDRPGDVLVQIRAADAARGDPDDDLALTWRERLGHFLDSEVSCRVEAKSPQPYPFLGKNDLRPTRRLMARSARPAVGRTSPRTTSPCRARRRSRVAGYGPCP